MDKTDNEMLVLGSIMTCFENADKFLAKFKEEDFSLDKHRHIYQLIKKWHSLGKEKFDINDIANTYPKAFDYCGGLEYVAEVLDFPLNPASYDNYAEALFKDVIKEQIEKSHDVVNNILKEDFYAGLDELVNSANAIYDRAKVKSVHNLYQTFMDGINPETKCDITVGFKNLHAITGEFKPGELIGVGARAGMGKTSFALACLVNYIHLNKKKALMFSLEMSSNEIFNKMISNVSNIPYSHIRDANLTEEERKCVEYNARQLSANPYLVLYEDYVADINSIAAAIRKESKTGEVGLVIVDYLQLLEGPGRTDFERITSLSRELKKLAAKYNCVIMALSQLNRKTEDKEDKVPSISELRGSGSIEQDCNKIFLLYRSDYYERNNSDTIVPIELDVAKNRNGGNGVVKFMFNKSTGRFSEAEDE